MPAVGDIYEKIWAVSWRSLAGSSNSTEHQVNVNFLQPTLEKKWKGGGDGVIEDYLPRCVSALNNHSVDVAMGTKTEA